MTRHFNPLDAVIKPVDITYVEGQTLDKIIIDTVKDPIHQNLCQISIGGAVVPRQNWAHVKPKAGQILKVQIIPRGRGAAKVLRTVLTIAVIAVAAWVTGGAALGLLGGAFGAGTVGAAVAGGLVGVVGQFAINAILPPPSPNRQQQEVDPLYTISGTRNQGRSDQVAPLILGRHRFTFDLLSQQYQQVVGENTYLVFLACVGIGNYDVQNLRIGDTPIEDFNGVTIQRSLLINSAPQTLLQGDFTQQNIGINLDNTSPHVRVVPAGTTDIDVILDFPRGLGTSDDRGRPERVSVGVSVRYRQIGDTVWQNRAPDNGADADEITNQLLNIPMGRRGFFGQFSNIGNFGNAVPNFRRNQLSRSFSRSDNQPFRSSLRLALPPGPAYEVEVRRTTAHDNDVAVGNDVTWSLLGAWADRDLTPDPRMSVLAVRILATDQLSGFVDQLNGDVGKIIPTLSVDNPENFDPALISYDDWSELSVSLNPADILLDAILGPHTDNPHNLDAINFESLSAFWQWCHIRNYRFSLPITSDVSRNELMDTICSAGRGRAYYYRGQLHIAIDRERLEGPRQVIGPENARNFVFSRSFGAANDALRVRFNNAENNYQEDLITVYRDSKNDSNANSFEDITLAGEVYPDQVFEKAQYIIDIADKANIIGRCEMDFEVETLQLGDYIRLQHPVLNAAASSGRVLQQTGQSIILSQAFEMDPTLDYVFVHRRIIGSDDDARIEVEGIYDLIPRAGQSDIVNLANPLPADVVMAYDDLYVVGIKGQATFEALIQDIRPTSAYEAEVSFLTYLPDALTVPNIPSHRPITSSGFSGPPAPIFAGSNVNNDIISVLFDVPALSSGLIQEFQCAYRTSGQRLADDEGRSEWVEAASLPGTARAFRFPIVSMAQSYDVRISAIDYDGLASSPLIVKDIIFSDFLISPSGIQAFPSTQSNETGGSVPIIRFQFTPVENPDLTNFIIEHRRATENEFAPFNQIYAGPTSINEIDIHGLLPGAKCDFRFAFQHQRGPLTRSDLRPILSNIAIPDSLVSSNTSHIGGVPSAVLLNEVAETLEANERLSNDVNDLFLSVEDGIRTSGLDRDFIAAAETRIAAIEDNAEDIQSEINIAHDQIIDDAASVSQSRSDILAIEETVNETRTEVVSLRNQTAALNQTAQDAVTATADNVLITSGHVDETSESAEAVRQDRIAAQGARGAAEQIETNIATIRDEAEGFSISAAASERLTAQSRDITAQNAQIATEQAVITNQNAAQTSLDVTQSSAFRQAINDLVLRQNPSTFEDGSLFFTSEFRNSPDVVSDTGSNITYPTVGQIRVANIQGYNWLLQKGVYEIRPNTAWEVTIVLNKSEGLDPTRYYALIYGLNDNYAHEAGGFLRIISQYYEIDDGIVTVKFAFTSDPNLEQSCLDRNSANGVTVNDAAYRNDWANMRYFRIGGLANFDTRTDNDHTHIRSLSCREITSELISRLQANLASSSSTIATEQAAAARDIASVSARISNNFINPNASFVDYDGPGIPPNWINWINGANGVRAQGFISNNAYRLNAPINASAGLRQISNVGEFQSGYYIIVADVILRGGSFRGSGVVTRGRSHDFTFLTELNLSFFKDPDQTGQPVGDGEINRRYRFTKLTYHDNPNIAIYDIFAMNHWAGLGDISETNANIEWHKCGIYPATQMEIDSGRVNEIEAQALISQNAIAENTGRNASFLEFNASSTAGETYAIIRSDSDTGRSIVLGTPELLITDDDGDNPRNFVRVQDGSIVASGDIEVGGGAFFGIGQGRIPFQLATRDFGNLRDGDVVQLNLPGAVNPTIRYRTDRLEPLGLGEQYDVSLQNLTPISGIVRAKIVASDTPVAVMSTGDQAGGANQPTRTLDKPYPDANSGEYTFTIRGVLQITRRVTTQSSGIPGQPSQSRVSYSGGFTLVTQFDTGSGYVQGPTFPVTPSDAGSPQSAGGFNFEKTFTVQFNDDIGQNSGREFGVSIFSGQNGADAITQIVSVEWSTAPQSGERSATTGGYRLSLSAEPANVPS